MRTRRGSAVLMSLILVAAITTVIAAELTLTMAFLNGQAREEAETSARYAFEGAVVQIVEDYSNDAISVPGTKSVTVGGLNCAMSVADNSGSVARTLFVSGEVTVKGVGYRFTKVVGARKKPSPFMYAVAVHDALNTNQKLTTGSGGVNGDVHWGNNLTLTGVSTINGDMDVAGTFTGTNTTVKGDTYQNTDALSFPSPSALHYYAASDVVYTGTYMNGYSFGSGGTYYPLVFCNGSLNISGTFSGRGTIFVHGNVTVSGNMSYSGSSSELAIICDGDVFFSSSVYLAVGYFFAGGNTIYQGSLGMSITRGGIVADNLYWNGTMVVNHDPFVWNSFTEGRKLRLPGIWP